MDTDDPHTAGPDAGDGRDLPARPPRPTGRAGLRVGDADRGAALDALGDHLAAGRLDIDEFGDRSALAAVAVHRADLEALFTDLPAPHPPLPDLPAPPAPSAPPAQRREARAAPVPPHYHHHRPVPAPVAGLGLAVLLLMMLPVVVVGAATTGSAGGLLILPLLFVVLGHAGRARRGRW
ncbi:DUF1707 domain-containing protein [Actinomycetospora lutea]|uniref:DUF1707 SHOCT-like domain-containing protein n=1 Tax=Actinomycetospora lutea TaxID=663604 RepID=UPI0023658A8F|nr:DUF1707 domain-containing protein [Actinomycetospora lutea]MDD7942258.1 DUF1707 domain-containing protein [Actinomycetospora lutea]